MRLSLSTFLFCSLTKMLMESRNAGQLACFCCFNIRFYVSEILVAKTPKTQDKLRPALFQFLTL